MRNSFTSFILVFLMLALSLSIATKSLNDEIASPNFEEAKTASFSTFEYDFSLSLPPSQSDRILIAPGQVSSVEFLIEHTGATSSSMEVQFSMTSDPFPSSWTAPNWDKPGGYLLNGSGSLVQAWMQFDVVDGDLTYAPISIEIEAFAYIEEENGSRIVANRTIVLFLFEAGDFPPPRISVFEDFEYQMQIADSTNIEAYNETISYVDANGGKRFLVNISNEFDGSFRFRINLPFGCSYYLFYSNTSREVEIVEPGFEHIIHVGYNKTLTLELFVSCKSLDSQDIGKIAVTASSNIDSSCSTQVEFTIQPTLGIVIEVIADEGGGTLGTVDPFSPGSSMSFNMRITDSWETLGQTTWRIMGLADIDLNLEETNGDLGDEGWEFAFSNGTEANIDFVYLEPDEYIDVELELILPSKIVPGNHTVYVRVIEEGVYSEDVRYFDLPITVEVRADFQPGRLEITDVSSEDIRFESNEERNINFTIENHNNILLPVIIALEEINSENITLIRASSQHSGSFLLFHLPAYSSEEFFVTLNSNLKDDTEVAFTLSVTPMDGEVPYDGEYHQNMSFKYQLNLDDDVDGIGDNEQAILEDEGMPGFEAKVLFLSIILALYVARRKM